MCITRACLRIQAYMRFYVIMHVFVMKWNLNIHILINAKYTINDFN